MKVRKYILSYGVILFSTLNSSVWGMDGDEGEGGGGQRRGNPGVAALDQWVQRGGAMVASVEEEDEDQLGSENIMNIPINFSSSSDDEQCLTVPTYIPDNKRVQDQVLVPQVQKDDDDMVCLATHYPNAVFSSNGNLTSECLQEINTKLDGVGIPYIQAGLSYHNQHTGSSATGHVVETSNNDLVLIFIKIPAHVQGRVRGTLSIHLEDMSPVEKELVAVEDIVEQGSDTGSQEQLEHLQSQEDMLVAGLEEKRKAREELNASIAEDEKELLRVREQKMALMGERRRELLELRAFKEKVQRSRTKKKKKGTLKRLKQRFLGGE